MSLFGWFSSKKQVPENSESATTYHYTHETREAVRKWLNRFFKGENVQDDFWQRVATYKNKNLHEPKVNDIIWGMLNERRAHFFQQGNLGFYRNDTMAMCVMLDLEGRSADQLEHAIHLITLDACGVANVDSWKENGGPFRLKEAFIAPVCAPMLVGCARSLDLSFEALKIEFLAVSNKKLLAFGSHRPDISSEQIWNSVQLDIKNQFEQTPKPKRAKSVNAPSLLKEANA